MSQGTPLATRQKPAHFASQIYLGQNKEGILEHIFKGVHVDVLF